MGKHTYIRKCEKIDTRADGDQREQHHKKGAGVEGHGFDKADRMGNEGFEEVTEPPGYTCFYHYVFII